MTFFGGGGNFQFSMLWADKFCILSKTIPEILLRFQIFRWDFKDFDGFPEFPEIQEKFHRFHTNSKDSGEIQ